MSEDCGDKLKDVVPVLDYLHIPLKTIGQVLTGRSCFGR